MIEFLALLAFASTQAANIRANGDPSQAASICAAPNSDDTLVAHEVCHKFYECSKGRPIAVDCPHNLLYNPDKDYCDWPDNVDCSGREVRGGSSQVIKEPVYTEPHDTQLTQYKLTNNDNGNGNTVLNYQYYSTRGNSDPSEAASICAQPGSDSILVAHEDCNKFYKCYKGEPVAINCPKGLLYNPNVQVCDWPQNVDCSGRNTGNLLGWFSEY